MPCCKRRSSTRRRPRVPVSGAPGAFTLVELLVLTAVVVLLLGLLIPAISASREHARAIECSTRVQQLGIALNLYMNDFPSLLPQVVRDDPNGGPARVSPLLFGGKRGSLKADGIDEFGTEARPLNRYVSGIPSAQPAAADSMEAEAFRSPADTGGLLPADEGGPARSLYERFGTSYVLNDRLLRASAGSPIIATLIPIGGGPMPKITTPERTWMLGSQPVRNFDLSFDRQMRWYGRGHESANLLMCDMHVRTFVKVPPGTNASTPEFTFLPSPGWPGQPKSP